MTLFVTFGWVGIGGEFVWPVVTLRLLLVSVGIVAGGMVQGWQRALARKIRR